MNRFRRFTLPVLSSAGFDIKRMEAVEGTQLTTKPSKQGAAGCFASHVEVYKDALNLGLDRVAIFEDDCRCVTDVSEFNHAMANLPPDADLAYLGGKEWWIKPFDEHDDATGWLAVPYMINTHAMIVSKRFMHTFLKIYAPPDASPPYGPPEHMDRAIIECCKQHTDLQTVVHVPSLIIQDITLPSDVHWTIDSKPAGPDFSRLVDALRQYDHWEFLTADDEETDCITQASVQSLLRTAGVSVSRFDPEGSLPIIVDAGDALSRDQSSLMRRLQDVSTSDRHIVILPHSIRNADIAGKLTRFTNAYIFTREQQSSDALHASGIRCETSEDLALLIDTGVHVNNNDKSLLSLRTDKSASRMRDTTDLCMHKELFDDRFDLLDRCETVSEITAELQHYSTVVTDYVSLACLAATMGKNVYLIEEKLRMNKHIFVHSLQKRFRACKYVTVPPATT